MAHAKRQRMIERLRKAYPHLTWRYVWPSRWEASNGLALQAYARFAPRHDGDDETYEREWRAEWDVQPNGLHKSAEVWLNPDGTFHTPWRADADAVAAMLAPPLLPGHSHSRAMRCCEPCPAYGSGVP